MFRSDLLKAIIRNNIHSHTICTRKILLLREIFKIYRMKNYKICSLE